MTAPQIVWDPDCPGFGDITLNGQRIGTVDAGSIECAVVFDRPRREFHIRAPEGAPVSPAEIEALADSHVRLFGGLEAPSSA